MAFSRFRRLLLLLAVLGLIAGFAAGAWAWDAAAFVIAAVVAFDVLQSLRRGTLGVDIIALLAIAGVLVMHQHLAAVIVAVMVAGGSALEEFAAARAPVN